MTFQGETHVQILERENEELTQRLAAAEAEFLDARKAAWYLWETYGPDEWARQAFPWLNEDTQPSGNPGELETLPVRFSEGTPLEPRTLEE